VPGLSGCNKKRTLSGGHDLDHFPAAFPLGFIGDRLQRIPSRGWAAIIQRVYEVDPMICPKCWGTMKVIAFITDFSVDLIGDFLAPIPLF
jgi:hypothetical protein